MGNEWERGHPALWSALYGADFAAMEARIIGAYYDESHIMRKKPITKRLHELEEGTLVRLPAGKTLYVLRRIQDGTRRDRTHYALQIPDGEMYYYPNVKKVVLLNDDGTDKIKTYRCYNCNLEMESPGRVTGNSTFCNDCKVCNSCGGTHRENTIVNGRPYCRSCTPQMWTFSVQVNLNQRAGLIEYLKRAGYMS